MDSPGVPGAVTRRRSHCTGIDIDPAAATPAGGKAAVYHLPQGVLALPGGTGIAPPPATCETPGSMNKPRTVSACVVIIGNEILSGRTQDTNLNHMALTLGGWGIQVREARVIPDLEDEIIDTVNEMRRKHDYVFTTGGIGPTHDDITSASIAKAFGVSLVTNPVIEKRIRSRPASPEVLASRLRMALIPEGASLVDNITGGPQGFCIGNVYVMAGIPAVMRAMLASLEGKLDAGPPVRSRTVTAYLGESDIASALRRIQDDFPEVDLGSYPFFRNDRYGTSLVMRGVEEDVLDRMLEAVKQAIVDAGETPRDVQSG